MNIVELTGNPVRFSIPWDGNHHKIFNYFAAAGDGSLAIHTYLPVSESGTVRLAPGVTKAVINVDEVLMTDFLVHKFNFHRSGVVTVKNKSGLRDDEGDKSVNLAEVTEAKTLAFLMPTVVDAYPIVDVKNRYYDLSMGNWDVLPPMIQFFISPKAFPFENTFIEERQKNYNWFVDRSILQKFNLTLYMSVKENADNKYPPKETFGVVLY